MPQTIFISDLHLSEKDTHLNELFDHFIQNTLAKKEDVDAVYILGDFFHLWIGDDAMGAWEKSIAEKLTQLVKQNIPVYIMVGNRDFLLGKSFVSLAKATLLSDPTLLNLYGKRVVLKHGDDLCLEDRAYQWFRLFVRSFFVKNAYLAMPLRWRQRIANRIRKKSHSREMRAVYAKISPEQVSQLLKAKQAEVLIHGHTHCPQIKDEHIILSDWNKQGNQLIITSEGLISLDYFS